jgi:ubiquinone biosynthesis protein UbiJ
MAKFARRVPAHERSHYVDQALAARLSERDQQLVRACEVANRDRKVRAIEKELDALQDEIAESQ